MSDRQKTSSLLGSGLLAGGLVLVFIGERVLPADFQLWGTGLGAALFAVAVGMRAIGMARSTGDTRAVETRILATYVGVGLALLGYYATTATGLETLGVQDEERMHFGAVATVCWLAIMLVSLGALVFMEQVYVRMPLAQSVEVRRVKTAASAGLMLTLSVVFLMSMNFVASERDIRKDVSYFQTTRPSDGSLRMVKHLDADVRVVLFFEGANDVLGQVRPYFSELAKRSGRIKVDEVDFDLEPVLARKHKVRGNGYVLLVTGEGDKQKGQAFKIGTELTASRSKLKKLDGTFQEHFAKVVRPQRQVFLTSGHGERTAVANPADPGEATKNLDIIFTRLNVRHRNLSIKEGLGAEVPDSASAVIVTGPREKFMPSEVNTLIKYVQEGGRLMLMLDPDVDNGLTPLLHALGLQLMPGVIASEKKHMRTRHGLSDRTIVYSNGYTSHPTVTSVMRNQRDVATVFYRGVAMRAIDKFLDLDPRPRVHYPLKGNGFFRDRNGNYERDAGEGKEVVNMIAAAVFKREGKDADGKPLKEGRAVIIGDGDFMTDRLAANNGNMLLFVDSLAWLIGNEDLVGEVNSEEDVRIKHSRDEDKMWFYLTTFGFPVPIAIIGIWNARRRRRLSEVSS